ncbi:MAG: methylmalonyl-CoA epimerase [Thaumarchaeota archaeon]|nr:MAG: methylmalonyl-CoA epimerase [Nitrososphaerota archaeon]
MKLHHIGIVVPRIKDSIGDLANYIKFETIGIPMPVGSQKVNICFLKVGEPFLELIEPVKKDSPVYDFAKNGGGIHHICFEVNDIHAQLDDMEKKGATVLVKPVIGFNNRLIAFVDLNMKNTRCGLIELLESKN